MNKHGILERLDEIKLLINGKPKNRWLCIKDVRDYPSVSDSTIRRAIKSGRLKVSQSTGKLLFKAEWVDRWLCG